VIIRGKEEKVELVVKINCGSRSEETIINNITYLSYTKKAEWTSPQNQLHSNLVLYSRILRLIVLPEFRAGCQM
jgi:hypothetical protein